MLSRMPPMRAAVVAAALILLGAFSAWAAEQADTSETEGDGDTGEVFVPSEEISEDFPAPFPVDI